MKPTLLLLLVAVAVVLQISETRVLKKKDVNGNTQYAYAVTAEEMAAGGYKRIARNADAPTEYDAVAAKEMAAASGYKRIARNADQPTEYDAIAAEEMAAAGGYERIARNANPLSCCGGCCDTRCTGRACSCCYA